MKKRKFDILLNIATLCLCITAIAIGVYSAKTASLNVSGTIGFTAHNIDYTAKVYMYGHSGTDGLPVAQANKIELTNTNSDKVNFEIGSKTFSDLGATGNPETIYIEIEVTNNSLFNVALKANLVTSTVDSNIVLDTPKDNSAVILADKNATDATTKTGKILYTLNVKQNTDGTYPEITTTNNVSLKVDLAKSDLTAGTAVRADLPVEIKEFTPEYVVSVKNTLNSLGSDVGIKYNDTVKCYAERYPYYVEMGQATGVSEKVNWLIVGNNDNDTLSTLTDQDKQALSEGLMLNKTYTMLSEKVLNAEKNTSNYGISFQNNYSNDSTTTPAYKNASGYSAQDYATSNIRNYLKGVDVYRKFAYNSSTKQYSPDGTSVNLLTTYNLTSDPLYAKIQGRTLTSLYTNIGTPTGTIWTKDDNRTEENLQPTTQDKLWLLSQTEMREVFKFAEDLINSLYRVSAITTIYGTTPSFALWWLRSPYLSSADHVYRVGNTGYFTRDAAIYNNNGSRPAFLL